MKTRILYLVLILCVTNLTSWLLSSYLTKRGLETKFANIELYDIANDPELDEILSLTKITDTNVNNANEEILLQRLFTVAIFHPDIEKMQGTPLTTLCKVISYKKHGGFLRISNGYKEFVMQYLASVEPDVFRYMENRKVALSKAKDTLISGGVVHGKSANDSSGVTTQNLPDCL